MSRGGVQQEEEEEHRRSTGGGARTGGNKASRGVGLAGLDRGHARLDRHLRNVAWHRMSSSNTGSLEDFELTGGEREGS